MNKKHAIALALLTGFAGAASAQSSVTAFGVVDVNGRYVENGDLEQYQLATDGLNSSRLGFRGIEDLGGGLSAGFWLEAGLNPDTGTINSSGKFWHRRSTVSLISQSIGELRLGRDYVPTYTGIADFDAFGDNGIGKFSNLQSRLGGTVNTMARGDNQVQYFTPKSLGGVYANLSVAAGEGNVGDKYMGGRIGYAAGPLNVSLAYGETQANANDDYYKLGALGASYDFGFLKLLGSVSQAKFINSREELLYLVGATMPFGQFVLRASYGFADLSGGAVGSGYHDDQDSQLFALGGVYNLSKRTALYTTIARIDNDGGQRFLVAPTPVPPAGASSTGFELGLRHSF